MILTLWGIRKVKVEKEGGRGGGRETTHVVEGREGEGPGSALLGPIRTSIGGRGWGRRRSAPFVSQRIGVEGR